MYTKVVITLECPSEREAILLQRRFRRELWIDPDFGPAGKIRSFDVEVTTHDKEDSDNER